MAAPVVTTSTVRNVGGSRQRHLDVLCPTLIAWVKLQPCEFCPGSAGGGFWTLVRRCDTCNNPSRMGGDPHHHPTTGSNGRTVDVLVVACCRKHHDLCDRAERNGGVPIPEQQAAAHRTWTRFWRFADPETQLAVAREIVRSLDHGSA